ncbi:VCBS repeat-containing protein, partial [Streptomyces sp. T-3]|nr:VCBS repeat-containing protein [Streptomyces sp. T-3]
MRIRVAVAAVGCAALLAGCGSPPEGAADGKKSREPVSMANKGAAPLHPVPRGDGSRTPDDFNGDGLRDLVLDDLVHDGQGDDAGIGIAYGSRRGGKRGIDAGARQLLSAHKNGATTKGELPAAFDSAASCDLNRDGFTDLVVATDPPYNGIGQPPVPLQILFGSPAGLGGKAVKLAVPGGARDGNEWPDQPVCGDFDGDNAADLVVHASNAQISFLRGPFAKKGTPRSGKLLKAPGTVLRGPALDVDRDGYDDLVVYAGGGTARSSL